MWVLCFNFLLTLNNLFSRVILSTIMVSNYILCLFCGIIIIFAFKLIILNAQFSLQPYLTDPINLMLHVVMGTQLHRISYSDVFHMNNLMMRASKSIALPYNLSYFVYVYEQLIFSQPSETSINFNKLVNRYIPCFSM